MPTLLVVDADPLAREHLQSLLPSERYQLAPADSAEEALALVESLRPDLVFCAVDQPSIDGFGLVARVGSDRKLPRTAFVLMHDAENEPDQDRVDRSAARGVLPKPLDGETLSLLLQTLVPLPPLELVELDSGPAAVIQAPSGGAVARSLEEPASARATSGGAGGSATTSGGAGGSAMPSGGRSASTVSGAVPPAFEAAVMRAVAQQLGVDIELLREANRAEGDSPQAQGDSPQVQGDSNRADGAGTSRGSLGEAKATGSAAESAPASVYRNPSPRVFVGSAERDDEPSPSASQSGADERRGDGARPPKSPADFERFLRRLVHRVIESELDAWIDEVAARVRRKLVPELERMLEEIGKRNVETRRKSER